MSDDNVVSMKDYKPRLGEEYPPRLRLMERAVLALERLADVNSALLKRLEEME